MTQENDWKRGMRRLEPGLYVDAAGALHIDSAEFLAAKGYAVTPENEALLREELPGVLREAGWHKTTIEEA